VPLGTAMLSHIALSLFLWNITLRSSSVEYYVAHRGFAVGSLAP
jgi:hypothetical protein